MTLINLEISQLEINSPYNFANPQINKFKNCLQQQDRTSCGPFLIENIYRDLVKQSEGIMTSSLAADIRQNHLTLLKEKNPKYYAKLNRPLA